MKGSLPSFEPIREAVLAAAYEIVAVTFMFSLLAFLLFHWLWLHRRIKLEAPSTRFRDIESGCACAENHRPCTISHMEDGDETNINSGLSPGQSDPPIGTDADTTSSPRCCRTRYFPNCATYIGTPAALDRMTRLIRATCKIAKARQPGKCGLCGQEIYEGDVIRTLPCSHAYHNLCILRWLVLSQMNCPDCYQGIPLY